MNVDDRSLTPHSARLPRQFYRMPLRPCPYLPGRTEQNIFTELAGPGDDRLYDTLTQAGFRRSHAIAYRPACPGCQACVAVRVVVDEFEARRSLRRVLGLNGDLAELERAAEATVEHYRLFARYVAARHDDGEMADMTFADYQAMVEESPLPSRMSEFRNGGAELLAACLWDRLSDGLSAVYSFFDPADARRGLGNYVVLRLIEKTRRLGLPYLYLGYWISESQKMSYKSRFRPLEALGTGGWKRLDV